MSKPHTHCYNRFLGSAIVRGDEMIRVGCRDCDHEIEFHANARAALTSTRVLDAIREAGEIDTHEIMERAGISARGYLVRILRHLRDQGHVKMLRRGVYGPRRPGGGRMSGHPQEDDVTKNSHAGAVEPRGNAACEAIDDVPMTPDEIRQNLAEMYRLAYALRIPTP